MATRKLECVASNCTETLLVLLLINIGRIYCQYIIPFKGPSDCNREEYFDGSSLSCVKCGVNQHWWPTGRSCICKTGYQSLIIDKASISCQKCPIDKPAVTKDGYGCIRCPGNLTDEGKCQCPPGNILIERDIIGNLLEEAKCEKCNRNTSSVPNSSGDRCETCQVTFVGTSCVCDPPNILTGGLCFPPSQHPTHVSSSVYYAQLKFSLQSAWFVKNLHSSSAACLLFSNQTACQALGNMCVMNMHSFSSLSTDACGLFNTIFRSKPPSTSTQDISYWRANLPWLYYGDEPGLASRVLQTNPNPIKFTFRGKNKNTEMKLLAAVYNVRGEFLQWEKVGSRNLQLCPDTETKQEAAFSFGTAYQQSCELSVADLMSAHPEPLFYDVFVDLGGGENRKLLPLPTLVYNQQYYGRFINQERMRNWYLTRRLFLVDTLSGRETSMSSLPKVIHVASSVKIKFQLVPDTQQGKVFPLLKTIMTVAYKEVPVTDIKSQTVSTTFAVEYEMDQSEARLKTDIALGVLGGLATIYSLLKTVSWKRRIGSSLIDIETILKFLLFYAGDLANVFFFVTLGIGLYWLIFYKAQHALAVLLPLPDQEEQFVAFVGCAFALKALQFLHKLVLQLSVDIFFIDWERPRNKGSRIVNATGEMKLDPSPVSIWRTYFVAKEWIKIQTIRKISPTFQVMAVIFFLEVLGFSNLALRDPRSTLERSSQAYTPSSCLILRYGLAASLWLCLGLLQGIYITVFHEHFVEDKIRRFVDLCSVSNISMMLLTQRCFGYYIHGRSVHGFADTNMEDMNDNMKRESESLCPQRGLLSNTDVQTFQVSLTSYVANQYERIRDPLSRRRGPSRLMDTSSAKQFEQNIRAYHTMNHFLGSFIDHAHPDMDYIVKDKLMFERVLEMEFLEPTDKSIFYNDEGHSFSDALFYGNEATLLIFDTLFFCVVDLGSQSFILSAVLTYAQQMIFHLIRKALGRRNLISKTLVDERFLI